LRGVPSREEEDLLSHLMFPEKPQDFGRLAASAIGLAYAGLGISERFFDLCKDIYEDITIKKQIKVDFRILKWMKRAGMFEILDQIKSGRFPSFFGFNSDGNNTSGNDGPGEGTELANCTTRK